MPVVVVALAAGSFAAGATAFAAAAGMAGMVAAGATMVGAALTIVGTVTGNAKLAKIGAVIGIAGGLGTMLTSGAEAAASTAAGAATDTAGTAANAAAGAASDAAGSAMQTVGIADPAAGITATGGGGMLDAASSASASAAPAAASTGGGMLDAVQPVAGNLTDPLAQATTSTTSAFDAANTTAGQAVGGNAFDAGPSAFNPNADMAMNPTAVPADPGMLSRSVNGMSAWAKANPELAKVALSAGGAALGNLMPSEKDKAMMEAYRQQAAVTAQQAEALKRKAAWGSGRTI